MTFRLVDTNILSGIANAVRRRNGQSRDYKPSELPSAVSELDGSSNVQGAQKTYDGIERGLVQDSVFKGIANALRIHNMSKRKYKPRDMAAAIDALSFESGEKPRALLHDSGVLEFNLYPTRRTDLEADVSAIWEVSISGYSSADDVPWLENAEAITSVEFRPSFQISFIADMSHWFEGCSKLVEVRGFDYVAYSLASVDAMFAGCTWLDSIFSEYAVSQRTRTGKPFDGCMKLVGQDLRVADDNDAGSVLHSGTGGMVVVKRNDKRKFLNVNLYAGGTLSFILAPPTKQYNCIATGRICGGVAYAGPEAMPYHEYRDRVKSVQFKSNIGSRGDLCLDWWFAGCSNIRGFTGWENFYSSMYYGDLGTYVVNRAKSMRHTFDGCDVARLELIGLDPSGLEDVSECFNGCGNLRTIVVSPEFAMPSGCAGSGVFTGCSSLLGGNGTAFNPAATGVSMMRIDAAGSPGYLSTN